MTVTLFSEWLEALRLCGAAAESDDHIHCRNLHARLTAHTYDGAIPDDVRAAYELAVATLFVNIPRDERSDPQVLIGLHDQALKVGGPDFARKGGTPFEAHGRLAKIYSDTVLFERLVDITKTQKFLGINPKPGLPQTPQLFQALKSTSSSFVPKPTARLRGKLDFTVFATCDDLLSRHLDEIDAEKDYSAKQQLCMGALDTLGLPLSRNPTSFVAIQYPISFASQLSRPTLMDAPAEYLFVSQPATPPHGSGYAQWGCASVSGDERQRRLTRKVSIKGGGLRGFPEVVHEPCAFDVTFGLRFVGFLDGKEPATPVPDLTNDILQS